MPRNPRPSRTEATQERKNAVVRMRTSGMRFSQIAEELGYASPASAVKAYHKALDEIPFEAVEQHRQLELQRLDRLIEEAWKLYEARHPVVSFGKVFFEAEGPDGEMVPIEDAGPKLAALKEIRALSESRRRLIGADAPTRTRIEVVTEDVIDAEIRRLEAELNLADRSATREDSPAP